MSETQAPAPVAAPVAAPAPAPHPVPQNSAVVAPVPATPEQQQELARQRYRNSRGAQVVLDPNSEASLAARGGAGGTIVENTIARDKHLLENDCNPRDPDASHLPGNVVPAGGEHMDHVAKADHEPKLVRELKANEAAAARG